MGVHQLLPASDAAIFLGLSPDVLRSWRRRGIGPRYVRFPGGRSKHGHICYEVGDLRAFYKRLMVQEGRLPRPIPGRLPGLRNRSVNRPAG
jgi:hypothetical protein